MRKKQKGELYFLPNEIWNIIEFFASDGQKKEDIEFLIQNIGSKRKIVELYCQTSCPTEEARLETEWENIIVRLDKILISLLEKKGVSKNIKKRYLGWKQAQRILHLSSIKEFRKVDQKLQAEIKHGKKMQKIGERIIIALYLARIFILLFFLVVAFMNEDKKAKKITKNNPRVKI